MPGISLICWIRSYSQPATDINPPIEPRVRSRWKMGAPMCSHNHVTGVKAGCSMISGSKVTPGKAQVLPPPRHRRQGWVLDDLRVEGYSRQRPRAPATCSTRSTPSGHGALTAPPRPAQGCFGVTVNKDAKVQSGGKVCLLFLGVNFLSLGDLVHEIWKAGREKVPKVDRSLRLRVRESQSSSRPGVEPSVVRQVGRRKIRAATATVVASGISCLRQDVELLALQFPHGGQFFDWKQFAAVPLSGGPVPLLRAGDPVHDFPCWHEAVDTIVILQRSLLKQARQLLGITDAGVAHQPLLDVRQSLLRDVRQQVQAGRIFCGCFYQLQVQRQVLHRLLVLLVDGGDDMTMAGLNVPGRSAGGWQFSLLSEIEDEILTSCY